jgi:hypothetical protein
MIWHDVKIWLHVPKGSRRLDRQTDWLTGQMIIFCKVTGTRAQLSKQFHYLSAAYCKKTPAEELALSLFILWKWEIEGWRILVLWRILTDGCVGDLLYTRGPCHKCRGSNNQEFLCETVHGIHLAPSGWRHNLYLEGVLLNMVATAFSAKL